MRGNPRKYDYIYMKKLAFAVAILLLIPFSLPDGNIHLPPPNLPSQILEEVIAKRASIREFENREISLENLSAILWAINEIKSLDERNAVKIYVLMKEGVYLYLPENHSLKLYRKGDFRWIGQYDTAAIKLGFVWDKNLCKNENIAASQVGMMGQNVYLMANSLGLGTVTTATKANELYLIGLPLHEKPLVIMPIGYPLQKYNFSYSPYETWLPFPEKGEKRFVDALKEKKRYAYLYGSLNKKELSQILWAGYGYSYYFDNFEGWRHRSVPSSHATYPLEIFYANSSAFYKYLPDNHSLKIIMKGDIRNEIANFIYSWILHSDIFVISLNKSKASSSWAWYYEAGAVWHNILLESCSFNLSANVVCNFNSKELQEVLQIDCIPLFVVQVGKEKGKDEENPYVKIIHPEEGFLYLFGKKIMPWKNTVIIGFIKSEIKVEDDSLLIVEYRVNRKLIGEDYKEPFKVLLPTSFKKCVFEAVAHDYFGNEAKDEIEYVKIM